MFPWLQPHSLAYNRAVETNMSIAPVDLGLSTHTHKREIGLLPSEQMKLTSAQCRCTCPRSTPSKHFELTYFHLPIGQPPTKRVFPCRMIEIYNPDHLCQCSVGREKDLLSYSTIPCSRHHYQHYYPSYCHCHCHCHCHRYCLADSDFVVLPTSVFGPPPGDRDGDDDKSTLARAQDPCHGGNNQPPPYDSPIPGFG